MTDKITRAELLANKLMNRTITPEEQIELNNWYSQNLDKEIEIPKGFVYSEEEHRSRILSSIRNHTHAKKQIKLWPRIVAAAAIAAVVFGAGVWYFGNKPELNNSGQFVSDIGPGKNGATLTLANGQKILINDALTGNIASESGVKISKTADGQIIYEVTGAGHGTLAYNTLTTTRGEQTQLRLPDGTLVYLNSESTLRYPTSFTKSDKRMVSLEGEGFFNVSKDKQHPFIVKTGAQEVEVLGTQFNINSYSDEHAIKTTLIEGSVKVTNANSVSKILKPNQQSTVLGKDIKVDNVEAQFFVDWKEGFFMFDNETLESIMNRVSRWYNVKVVYEDAVLKKEKASGTVSKFNNISSVLQALEQSDLAKFKLSNGILTISKKK
ncbi:FecR family protein [Pedobacter africanus]|uniref:FecR family protein n=1 Tax=Pedobacter africanus TaxID=151894 RepID=A0A1W2CU53_9SPHI|nr:FecR domain-containing protein [Pedobacter africanus]SMC88770.1 FecR family protein [Pedobacter africanus]